jgi:hypothetical protein
MSAGALEIETSKYVLPHDALKERRYHCVECGDRVIPRQGEIRAHHFAHHVKSNCTYFEHPNESQVHKDAKYRLAEMLKQKKKIKIKRCCKFNKCEQFTKGAGGWEIFDIIHKDDDEVKVEFRGPGGAYIADVALLNDGKPRYIFEIKYTHATATARPEPWFEINAGDYKSEYLHCVREGKCDICKKFDHIEYSGFRLPKIYPRYAIHNWEQYRNCVICKQKKYFPVKFYYFHVALCKKCFINEDWRVMKKTSDIPKKCLIDD